MDLENILLRIIAVAKESLASLTPTVVADGRPYLYAQEETPYFCTRITAQEDTSESMEINSSLYRIELRLIMGKLTQGYDGETQSRLYRYMPTVISFLKQRIWLQSTAYPTRPADLLTVNYLSCGGLQVWVDNTGDKTPQYGTSFLLECEFKQSIVKDYF